MDDWCKTTQITPMSQIINNEVREEERTLAQSADHQATDFWVPDDFWEQVDKWKTQIDFDSFSSKTIIHAGSTSDQAEIAIVLQIAIYKLVNESSEQYTKSLVEDMDPICILLSYHTQAKRRRKEFPTDMV